MIVVREFGYRDAEHGTWALYPADSPEDPVRYWQHRIGVRSYRSYRQAVQARRVTARRLWRDAVARISGC